jgi:acetyl-CoA carboxylase biotin carboxyl carrier protein
VATDRRSPAPRRAQDRLDDHAAIDHLADDLLPALVAKLGASGLGEIEIREGTWRVRLRMPADGNAVAARRPASGRTGSRAADAPHAERARADSPGAAGTGAVPGSPLTATAPVPSVGPSRLVATSPAVGYFRPRGDLSAGTKVRAGDRIASVDVLGIGQDVVAPGDGLIGATLVEPGEPVEYGQAIIVLEQLTEPRPQPPSAVPGERVPAEPAPAAASSAGVGPDTVESAPVDATPVADANDPAATVDATPAAGPDPDASQLAEAE